MARTRYLIVGGGMAADAAAKGIRELDPEGEIALISAEHDPPYDRPPLSKKLWTDPRFSLERVMRKTEAAGVTLHLGRRVERLLVEHKQVVDDRGETHGFDKLLLATGVAARRLPALEGVIYLRDLDDFRRLRSLCEAGERFAVIGGGFIGSEIAAALATVGKHVIWIFPEASACHRLLPPELGLFINDTYAERGVQVLAREQVLAVSRRGEQLVVRTRSSLSFSEREHFVAGVVAGVGSLPELELARQARLEVGDGILVDATLRTSHPEIFAAGDNACYYDLSLGERRRVEHEDNALRMGQHAGRAMAGEVAPYRHQPFFYSDLFDLGYEAVGELDARLETVADWKTPNREGVIYYARQGRVRGVLLWNVWGQVDAARRLIAEARVFGRPDELRGALEATQ